MGEALPFQELDESGTGRIRVAGEIRRATSDMEAPESVADLALAGSPAGPVRDDERGIDGDHRVGGRVPRHDLGRVLERRDAVGTEEQPLLFSRASEWGVVEPLRCSLLAVDADWHAPLPPDARRELPRAPAVVTGAHAMTFRASPRVIAEELPPASTSAATT